MSQRETLDQVRAAESECDDGLAGLVKLIGHRLLFGGNIYVALAIADADEEREDRRVVRARIGQFQIAGVDEAGVGAQCGDAVEAGLQFALEVFARIWLGIGVEREEQRAIRLCAVDRQRLRRIA